MLREEYQHNVIKSAIRGLLEIMGGGGGRCFSSVLVMALMPQAPP